MIDINNTAVLKAYFNQLQPSQAPLFGKMSPQHMVEHLAFSIRISTGKNPVKFYNTPEVGEEIKKKVIYSPTELQQGVKNPVLGDEPPALIHANLEEAIATFFEELAYFHTYYREHPQATHTQPRMGELNYSEWSILHSKHIAHHLKQFDLLTA